MKIERIQVHGGFLDGLDLSFSAGLNVIIGERGTGKTSIIELLRFCLAAPGLTSEAKDRGNQQAISVLAGGSVVVTLREDEQTIVVERGSDDSAPASTGAFSLPTVLAQNEIETVGAQASGRLALVDRMVPGAPEMATEIRRISSRLESKTAEIQGLLQQSTAFRDQLDDLRDVPEQLAQAVERQQEILASLQANEKEREELGTLQSELGLIGSRGAVFERTQDEVGRFGDRLVEIVEAGAQLAEWPDAAGPEDMLRPVRAELTSALANVSSAIDHVGAAALMLANLDEANGADKSVVGEAIRNLRDALEELQEGVGETTRSVERLQELDGQRTALVGRIGDLTAQVERIADERRRDYEALDTIRTRRFEHRRNAANSLTALLRPAIQVRATRSASTDAYASSIAAGLRGSGLHYNTWAPMLAGSMPPLELVEALESGDASLLASAAGLPEDRAGAVAQQLRATNLSTLIAVPIDDGITMELLDGSRPKSTDEISIGQRCTVVLPILLAPEGLTLIVDQPEDHLDNAFVADTLVEAIRRRSPYDQLIFTSHNANIPVLGGADCVFVMGSNGRRGFKQTAGDLDSDDVRTWILSLLEGGDLAFKKRAAYYESTTGPTVE